MVSRTVWRDLSDMRGFARKPASYPDNARPSGTDNEDGRRFFSASCDAGGDHAPDRIHDWTNARGGRGSRGLATSLKVDGRERRRRPRPLLLPNADRCRSRVMSESPSTKLRELW